jgi:hypothetical protein
MTVDRPEKNTDLVAAMKAFIDRERFMSKFQIAKHSGVTRGDWILHLTADPDKEEGKRLTINSVHPASYFPIYDEDDPDRIVGVNLVDQIIDPIDPTKVRIRLMNYQKDPDTGLIIRREDIVEVENWYDIKKRKIVQKVLEEEPLDSEITAIPVYHFRNQEWQGEPFGRSELNGFELLMGSINQTVTDEEIALALEGLGVYYTDSGPPQDEDGNDMDWVVAPGRVMEVDSGTAFHRVQGLNTVKPSLDHVRYLEATLHEASGTSDVALGRVDVQTAESGIALAIKFMPTLAKIEERDIAGVEVLTQFWYDWKFWHKVYEGQDFLDTDIIPVIGDKLPENRKQKLDELNNLLDRKVISRQYYRQEMEKMGYKFPDDIEQQILKEAQAMQAIVIGPGGKPGQQQDGNNPPGDNQNGNRSNNRNRTNESNGAEAGNTVSK